MKLPPRLSPVDYDAWSRGYMPPSEHVLIHELTYEGAKVMASSHAAKNLSWWLVTKGERSIEELEFMAKTIEMQIGFLKRSAEKREAEDRIENTGKSEPATPKEAE